MSKKYYIFHYKHKYQEVNMAIKNVKYSKWKQTKDKFYVQDDSVYLYSGCVSKIWCIILY